MYSVVHLLYRLFPYPIPQLFRAVVDEGIVAERAQLPQQNQVVDEAEAGEKADESDNVAAACHAVSQGQKAQKESRYEACRAILPQTYSVVAMTGDDVALVPLVGDGAEATWRKYTKKQCMQQQIGRKTKQHIAEHGSERGVMHWLSMYAVEGNEHRQHEHDAGNDAVLIDFSGGQQDFCSLLAYF